MLSLFLTATLSYMCYCKLEQFMVYVVCWAYIIIRTFFWAQDHPTITIVGPKTFTIQLGLYLFLMLFFLYFFSRENQKRDRDVFKEKNNQKQVITLFKSIIRTHHDGITITQGEDIVFHNQQMSKIMNVDIPDNPTNTGHKLQNHSLVNTSGNTQMQEERKEKIDQQNLVKQHIVEAMKKTKIHQNQMVEKLILHIQMNKSSSQDQMLQNQSCQLDTIWDYILVKNQQKDLNIQSQCSNISEGVNFKMKYQNEKGNIKSKKLQAFSQILHTGQKTFVVTTVRDMSHWMELEKEKNITLYKTQAFASAAHEFRNPLGAIIHSLDLLKDSIDYQKGYKFYHTAKNCSNLMLYLVNDILDYSQLETKELLLNYEAIDIQSILEECTSVLKFRAELKDLDLSYSVDKTFPDQFMVDQYRLRQILINLLSNAIKYTDEGFVRIHCYFQSYKQQIVIEVQDSGVGIEKLQMDNLFIAYKKIMKNRSMNKDGCGLGLTISKNLSKALGGDLKVSSVVGQGSVFAIVLPFNPPKEMNKLQIEFSKGEKKGYQILDSNTPIGQTDTNLFPILSDQQKKENYEIKFDIPQNPSTNKLSILGRKLLAYDLKKKNRLELLSQIQKANSSSINHNLMLTDLDNDRASDRITRLVSQIPDSILKNINSQETQDTLNTPRLQPACQSDKKINAEKLSNIKQESKLYCSVKQDKSQALFFQKSPLFEQQTTNLSAKQFKNNFIDVDRDIEEIKSNDLSISSAAFDISKNYNISITKKSQPEQTCSTSLQIKGSKIQLKNIEAKIHINADQSIFLKENSKIYDLQLSNLDKDIKILIGPQCPCPQILIADDDPFNIIALEGLINQIHIGPIDTAFNGRDAYAKFEINYINYQQTCKDHQAYKLVILDNQMPFLRGIEVAKKIREIQNLNRQNAKIVLLSGDNFSQQSNIQNQGIFDYVVKKPVSMAALKIILQQVFAEQQRGNWY
eukprot:403338764